MPAHTRVGQLRDRVAPPPRPRHRGRGRTWRQVEYVFYAQRDHHVRAPHSVAGEPPGPSPVGRGPGKSRPASAARCARLIAPDRPRMAYPVGKQT